MLVHAAVLSRRCAEILEAFVSAAVCFGLAFGGPALNSPNHAWAVDTHAWVDGFGAGPSGFAGGFGGGCGGPFFNGNALDDAAVGCGSPRSS